MRRFLHILLILSLFIVGGCGFISSPVLDNADKQVVSDSPINEQIVDEQDGGGKTEADDGSANSPKEENTATGNEARGQVTYTESIRLRVSQNFGQDIIFNQAIPLKNDDDLLKIMQDNLELDTSYGGSFISGINGIKMKSGAGRSDWFLYINGIASHTGLRDYVLNDKDEIYWDYHRWNPSSTNNAIIGAYPAPFLGGYRGNNNPTSILHDETSANLVYDLAASLEKLGVKVNLNNISAGIKNEPTIVIGTWDNLVANQTLYDLNKGYKRNGMNVHFTSGGLELLDYKGQVAGKGTDKSAVIVAWGRALGDANPLWLIVGTDESGLQKAVNTLINNPENIQGLYGVAILPQGNIALPLK